MPDRAVSPRALGPRGSCAQKSATYPTGARPAPDHALPELAVRHRIYREYANDEQIHYPAPINFDQQSDHASYAIRAVRGGARHITVVH